MPSDLPDIDALWDYRDDSASEARFRAVLDRPEFAADPAYLAELLTQLARAQGRQKRFEEAGATLDRAQQLMTPAMVRARVRLLLERGRVFNSAGEPAKALTFFTQAYDLALGEQLNRLAVDAIHMIAIAEADPTSRIDWNLKGVALAERLDERGWLYALYNNLGEAYAAIDDYAAALATFQKLVRLDVAAGKEPDLMAQKDVAKMLRLSGRAEESLAMIEEIAQKLERAGTPNAWIDEERAESLHARGREAEAKPLFARAYANQKDDDWVRTHEAARLERLRQFGGIDP